jgi:periplasmic divalent cation tolerance protein
MIIFIYSTFSTKKEAKEIGKKLIQNKLATCINIFPIESVYSWQRKIVQDKEFAVIIKTKKENFKRVEEFILNYHSYDTPCILEIPIKRITKKCLKWINKTIS